jgi:hypothetical protein
MSHIVKLHDVGPGCEWENLHLKKRSKPRTGSPSG